MSELIFLVGGVLLGAVAVPLCPPLFRLAEKIRAKLDVRVK